MNATRYILSSSIGALLCTATVFAQPPSYVFTDIGALGGNTSVANGISSTGHVTGNTAVIIKKGNVSSVYNHAFAYFSGNMVDLGTFLNGNVSAGMSINATGTVAGFSQTFGSTVTYPTIRVPGTGYIALSTSSRSASHAIDINNLGWVTGDIYISTSTGSNSTRSAPHVFLYKNARLFTPPDISASNTDTSYGKAINRFGIVAGYAINLTDTNYHAFITSTTGAAPTDLGTLPGGETTDFSEAFGINDGNLVVGNSSVGSGAEHAFIYDQGSGMFDMGVISGGPNSWAVGINNDGDVVGLSATNQFGTVPFVYLHGTDIATGTMIDLTDAVENPHLNSPGDVSITGIVTGSGNYILETVTDINDFGQIVGACFSPLTGTQHGYILTPTVHAPAPTVTTPPDDVVILAGSNLTIDSGITGGTPLTFVWTKNNANIANQSNSTIALTNMPVGASGTYKATATNLLGTINSTMKLTVVIQPGIAKPPVDAGAVAGKTAKFTVTGNGTAPLNYLWETFNGTAWNPVLNGSGVTGNTSATLSIANTTLGMNGTLFRVTVNNAIDLPVTSANVTLVVGLPPTGLTLTPASSNLTETDPLTLTTTINGNTTTPVSYVWSLNKHVVVGETNSTLVIASANASNVGTYSVVVSNPVGNATASAKVAVKLFPNITVQPVDAFVVTGKAAKFTLTATGTPKITYQWQVKPPAGSFTDIPKATTNTFSIAKTTADMDGNQYQCILNNSVGPDVTSDVVTLHLGSATAITVQPIGGTATAGDTPTLNVTATGTGTLHYQWKKNVKTNVGTDSNSFTLPAVTTNATTGGAGSYTVVVSTNFTTVTSKPAVVKVVVAPTFVTQPVDASVNAGKTAKFTVKAAGATKYQWQSSPDGIAPFTDILKATAATYTTPVTTGGDDGKKFRCIISNAASTPATDTSNVVTLTVNS